jgi:glutathione S-transferase
MESPSGKTHFEQTLKYTDALLSQTMDGPFFCGAKVTAANIAWASFL